LAASLSLREFSQRKRMHNTNSNSGPAISLEEIDRMGGNGRWRQRKAEQFFKEQEVEDIERAREQRLLEERRRKRRMELEARRRRQLQEEEAKREADKQREIQIQLEKELAHQRELEEARIKREKEEQEWLALQPKPCEACSGSGLCAACEGKGRIFCMFLANHVAQNASKDFGRAPQGCEDCGGVKQNMVGKLQPGSGACAACGGSGLIYPKGSRSAKMLHKRRPDGICTSAHLGGDRGHAHMDMSPISCTSSPTHDHSPKTPHSPGARSGQRH